MPTYTYKCDTCGVIFDKVQKFTDKPLTRCPECSKGKVKRVVQASAIVFKGSGWYATDHRSPSGQAAKKTESESGGEKPEKTEKSDKAESKPKVEAKETKAAKTED